MLNKHNKVRAKPFTSSGLTKSQYNRKKQPQENFDNAHQHVFVGSFCRCFICDAVFSNRQNDITPTNKKNMGIET